MCGTDWFGWVSSLEHCRQESSSFFRRRATQPPFADAINGPADTEKKLCDRLAFVPFCYNCGVDLVSETNVYFYRDNDGKVPDVDIERAMERKQRYEQDPADHRYMENINDG